MVDDYMNVEIEEGWILGLIAQAGNVHTNQFGLITKTTKWKVEVHCRLVPSGRGKYT